MGCTGVGIVADVDLEDNMSSWQAQEQMRIDMRKGRVIVGHRCHLDRPL